MYNNNEETKILVPSEEDIENLERLPPNERVYVHFGLIASVDIEDTSRIIRWIKKHGGKIIYQAKCVENQKMWIVKEGKE